MQDIHIRSDIADHLFPFLPVTVWELDKHFNMYIYNQMKPSNDVKALYLFTYEYI